MKKQTAGWSMLGFLVFILLCGLSIPLGMCGHWWYSLIFVVGTIGLVGWVALAHILIGS